MRSDETIDDRFGRAEGELILRIPSFTASGSEDEIGDPSWYSTD